MLSGKALGESERLPLPRAGLRILIFLDRELCSDIEREAFGSHRDFDRSNFLSFCRNDFLRRTSFVGPGEIPDDKSCKDGGGGKNPFERFLVFSLALDWSAFSTSGFASTFFNLRDEGDLLFNLDEIRLISV